MVRVVVWGGLCFSVVAFGQALRSDCPKGWILRGGLCYLQSPYLNPADGKGLRPQLPDPGGIHPKKIDLGRLLFFDPILSKNRQVSCASCHSPHRGLSDGRPLSRAIDGGELDRGAPPLWNLAFYDRFFWDGRAETLESQLEGPLFSKREMGMSRKLLVSRLRGLKNYRRLFKTAFGDSSVSVDRVIEAIVAFEKTLVSLNSRFDRYAFGDAGALSPEEYRGWVVFRSFSTRCMECHEPPLFTNFQMANLGVPHAPEKTAFRIPSLRNVTETAPYMHNGVFGDLLSVVDFYDLGGGRSSDTDPTIHWHVGPIGLQKREKRELIAFLGTLNDHSAMPEIPESVPSGLPVGGNGP